MNIKWPFSYFPQSLAAVLFANYHEGSLITDNEGIIVYYNNRLEKLDGLTQEEVLGRHILDVYNLDASSCISTRCLSSGRPINNAALYYQANNGNRVNAICNAYPIMENNRLAGCVCHTTEYNSLVNRLEITARNYAMHPYSIPEDDADSNGTVYTLASIVGESPALTRNIKTAQIASQSPSAVMICGETGTGKELFAQSIHNYSVRRSKPFCPVNCAAIPEALLEGILFGTTKGAFTGSIEQAGLFEVSSGGTIFLDEIHTMPLSLQAKLLRVIQEQRIRRIGGSSEKKLDLKIISSINQNPELAVKNGLLRPDLFYRLGVIILEIAPLRLRKSDINLLVANFVKKNNHKLQGKIKKIEPEFLTLMDNYDWPGNVRELEHVVETCMNFAVSEPNGNQTLGLRHIQSGHLRKFLTRHVQSTKNGPLHESILSTGMSLEEEPSNKEVAVPVKQGDFYTCDEIGLKDQISHLEKSYLCQILQKTGGNLSAAARKLGVSRQNLYYKLKKHDMVKYGTSAENIENMKTINSPSIQKRP